MKAIEIDPKNRPSTVGEWITELEAAAEDVIDDKLTTGTSRLVILAPVNAEVYINDERKGIIGNSGKLILTTVPAGQHVLRVSKVGEKDDERVIEIREDTDEQVIQAQLKPLREASSSQPSPSHSSGGSGAAQSSVMPGIVACTVCNARFAQGVKFCGKCNNRSFNLISEGDGRPGFPCPRCSMTLPPSSKFCGRCGLNIGQPEVPAKTPAVNFQVGALLNIPARVEKICQKCGSRFAPDIKYCGRCGSAL